jgi:hypothetical protein
LALFAQFSSFALLFLISFGFFVALAGPYGWPAKSFFKYVPPAVQRLVSFVVTLLFILPTVISCVFYALLVCSRTQIMSNKVGTIVEENKIEIDPKQTSKFDLNKENSLNDWEEIHNGDEVDISTSSNATYQVTESIFKSNNDNDIDNDIDNDNIEDIENENLSDNDNNKDDDNVDDNDNDIDNDNIIDIENENDSLSDNDSDNDNIKDNMSNNDNYFDTGSVNDYVNDNEINNENDNGNEIDNGSDSIKNNNNDNDTEAIEIDNHFINVETKVQHDLQDLANEEMARSYEEKMAAIRSLKTNLILILLFFVSGTFLIIPSQIWKTYFVIVDTAIQKALLPIVTTLVNFGTIRSVGSKFWNLMLNKKTDNERI